MPDSQFHYNKVLLIDDSEIDVLVNRRLIELTKFSANVIVTVSGEEGINFLRNECKTADQAPDWIFLDMHLPEMNGYEFIEEFKTLPSFIRNKTRIIILSVFQKQERLRKVFENNFIAGQLEKPLTQQALKEVSENKLTKVHASF